MKFFKVIFVFILLFSCKKWKYDQVRIHGRVINGTLGQPMPGEQVSLIEVKDEFLGPGNSKTIKTVTTNANGEYDFGGMDLRKKDKFDYFITYVHRGITTQGFCDSYEVDKHSIDQNKNLVVFVGAGGVQFRILPDMSVVSASDSIKIEINTSADFSIFSCNPNAAQDYDYFDHITVKKESFLYSNPTSAIYGINAYYYLKITKLKAGITTVDYDTFYVQNDYLYQINW